MKKLFYRLLAGLLAIIVELALKMGLGSDFTRVDMAAALVDYKNKIDGKDIP